MRKRCPIQLLSLLLALCLLPWLPVGAQAATAPLALFKSELMDMGATVASAAWLKDTLYILTTRGLYLWREGDRAAAAIPGIQHTWEPGENPDAPRLHALTTHDGHLLGLDGNTGKLYTLTVQEGAAALTEKMALDWSPFQQGDAQNPYVDLPAFVTAIQGRLFVRVNNYEQKVVDLFSYDLQTGAMKQHAVTHLNDIVPYKEGLLLALQFDQSKLDPKTMRPLPPDIVVMDPATDQLEKLTLTLPAAGKYGWTGNVPLWYAVGQDAIFIMSGGQLQLISADTPVLSASLPSESWGSPNGPAIVPYKDDLVFLLTQDNVFIRSTNPQNNAKMTTLSINLGWLDSRFQNQALLELGNVRLAPYEGGGMDNKALAAHLLTGQDPFDLLVLDTGENDIQQLMKKGYLVDLSQSEVLRAHADSAFSTFQRVIRSDAGLFAIPIDIQTHSLSANTAYFEALEQPVPRSVPALLALVRWWEAGGHELREDDALLDSSRAKNRLKEIVYSAYMDSMIGRGETLSFDMDTFGAMMLEIDALKVEPWDLPANYGSGDDDDIYIPNILLGSYSGFTLSGMQWDTGEHLFLSPDGQQPGYSTGRGRVLAVSARSTQKEAAIQFLEAYVRNMSEVARASLSADWRSPIENPNYEQEYRDKQGYLAQYRALYEAAPEGAAKRQYAEDVKHFEQELEAFEQTHRYLVTEERLKTYQALMQHVFVDDSLSQLQQKALSTDGYLFGMYLEGTLTLEQFIHQANSKIRLMLLEAE